MTRPQGQRLNDFIIMRRANIRTQILIFKCFYFWQHPRFLTNKIQTYADKITIIFAIYRCPLKREALIISTPTRDTV